MTFPDFTIGNLDKAPSEVLDYSPIWTDRLAADGGDTIFTSVFAADTGITIEDDSHGTTETVVWLSGGTAGHDYAVSNTITTVAGRTYRRTFIVRVRNL